MKELFTAFVAKVLNALSSRTVWTMIALFLVNNVDAITALVPAGHLTEFNLAMGLLGIYFRVNPRV